MLGIGMGRLVQAELERRSWSQLDLARRVTSSGISRMTSSYVSQLVNGQIKNIGANKLEALAHVLDLPVDELLRQAWALAENALDASSEDATVHTLTQEGEVDWFAELLYWSGRLSATHRRIVFMSASNLARTLAQEDDQTRGRQPLQNPD